MKKQFILASVLLFSFEAKAQFTSGGNFHIAAQTLVTIDGLALKPSIEDFALRNRTISAESRSVAGNSGNSIKRVYSFDQPVKFTGEAGIVYLSDDLNQNSENNLQLAYADNQGAYHTTLDSRVNLVEHFIARDFDAENLVKLTAVDASVALPVKLVAFSAKKSEKVSLLEWSTSEEVSSDHFEVQRSHDGMLWEVLGQVVAGGESSSLQHYAFTDSKPGDGENFYRLKMVDADGTFAFSKLALLEFSELATVYVYPNPVSQLLHVKAGGDDALESVRITNLAGQVVCRSGSSDIKLGTLPTGTYIVEVTLKSGAVRTSKIVRN